MTIKILNEYATPEAFDLQGMLPGHAYRHIDGDLVIATDEGSVLKIENGCGYLAGGGHYETDVFYPVTLEVKVVGHGS